MCIIFLAHGVHPKYKLVIATNRDEFFHRPTEPMKIWTAGVGITDNSSSSPSGAANDDVVVPDSAASAPLASMTPSPPSPPQNNNAGISDESKARGNSRRIYIQRSKEFDTDSNTGLDTTTDAPRNDNDTKQQQNPSRGRVSLAGKDLVMGGTWLGLDVPTKGCNADNFQDEDDDCNQNNEDNNANNNNNSSISHSLRWIALTNFRGKHYEEEHGKPSRGELLLDFLGMDGHDNGDEPPAAKSFVSNLQQQKGKEYNGFNLLVGDEGGIYYYGNQDESQSQADEEVGGAVSQSSSTCSNSSTTPRRSFNTPTPLPPGIYGLSNALLDTPWPKVERGKEMLHSLCKNADKATDDTSNARRIDEPNNEEHDDSTTKDGHRNESNPNSLECFHESLMDILHDQTQPPDDSLPDTGLGLELERYLSSIFVPREGHGKKEYGTRCSTTIVVETSGKVSVLERTWPMMSDQWFHFQC